MRENKKITLVIIVLGTVFYYIAALFHSQQHVTVQFLNSNMQLLYKPCISEIELNFSMFTIKC